MEIPKINKRLEYLIDKYAHGSQQAFARDIGVSQGTINRLYNVDPRTLKVPKVTKNTLEKVFNKYKLVSRDWLIDGIGEPIIVDKTKSQTKEPSNKPYSNKQKPSPVVPEPKDDLEPQPLKGLTKIHIVQNTNAMAGWLDNYYADEYLEQLPTIQTPTEKNHSGLYLAFKVINDSMEPDYIEGDTVIGREVSRVYWKDKLHIHKWDFIIAHNTKGVLIKEITEHNPETGEITLHSLNPNYEDQVVNLKEVSRIFNVVDHRPDIVKRRLRRK